MMVKNESERLAQCLDTINNVVDELIVVDTGSTDATVQIAQSYQAKIYHHLWEKNFSKHRNQSISYASGDWILIIDADEHLDLGTITPHELKITITDLSHDIHAILCTVKNIMKTGQLSQLFQSPRLFRNDPRFHYEGTVHNVPVYYGKTVSMNIAINHYGFALEPDKMKLKFERTTSLLHERIQKNSNDAIAYFYLSNAYGFHGYFEDSIRYGKQCLRLSQFKISQDSWKITSLYRTIGRAYRALNQNNEALSMYLQGLEIIPDDPDLHFELTKMAAASCDFESIIKHGNFYLTGFDRYTNDPSLAKGRILFSLDISFKRAIQYYVINAYLGLNQCDSAEQLWQEVKTWILEDASIHEEFLKNLCISGCNLLLSGYIHFLIEHQQQALELSTNPNYLFQMGNLCLDMNQPAFALSYYQKLINQDLISVELLEQMKIAFQMLNHIQGVERCDRLQKKLNPSIFQINNCKDERL